MDSSDDEVQRRAAAGRGEVDPPMQVAMATWLGSWIGAGKKGGNRGVAYAVETAVNGGLELLRVASARARTF
jgi:hypothetical protein